MSYTIRVKNGLNTRQNAFVKHLAAGNSGARSAVLSGYSRRSSRSIASRLLTKDNIRQHLQELLDRAGLSDEALIARLKTILDAGIGQKANNSDSIKALKLAFELKGSLQHDYQIETTQQDETMVKLQHMSKEERMNHLEQTSKETLEIIARLRQRRLERKNGDDNKAPIPQIKTEPVYVSELPTPSVQDTGVRKAIGIPVEMKSTIKPVHKAIVNTESSEDKRYNSKISYPA